MRGGILSVWQDMPFSLIQQHEGECCIMARCWIRAYDHSMRHSSEVMPAWIRKRYEWGPCSWPLHWCDIPLAKKLDCGALAAVGRVVLENRGLTVLPCQLIQRYDECAISNWRSVWQQAGASAGWANGCYCYHEVCGILNPPMIRLWDPTDNVWVPAPDRLAPDTYGHVVRIRIGLPQNARYEHVDWGPARIPLGQWWSVHDAPMGLLQAWPP